MNEKLKNLNKKQFEKCLITLEMLTFETPKIYTGYCHDLKDNPPLCAQNPNSEKNGDYLLRPSILGFDIVSPGNPLFHRYNFGRVLFHRFEGLSLVRALHLVGLRILFCLLEPN